MSSGPWTSSEPERSADDQPMSPRQTSVMVRRLERVAALDAALDELAASFTDDDGLMRWEYLLFTATKR